MFLKWFFESLSSCREPRREKANLMSIGAAIWCNDGSLSPGEELWRDFGVEPLLPRVAGSHVSSNFQRCTQVKTPERDS